MATVHETQVTYWMSRLAETAYGTRQLAASQFVRILAKDRQPFTTPQTMADDAGYANGSDLAENMWGVTNDASKTFAEDFCFQNIGYWLHLALGAVSAATVTGVSTHTFTPQSANTSRQLPTRTFGQKIGGLFKDIFTSVAVNQLNISGNRTGRLEFSAETMGNGFYETDPASYVEPALSSGLVYAYANQASLSVNNGAAKTYTCDLESWSWVLNNNLDADGGFRPCAGSNFISDNPEAGMIRKELLLGQRAYEVNFVARLQASDPMRANLKAGTIVSVTNTITSPVIIATAVPYSMTLAHTRGRVIEANHQIDGNYVVISGKIALLGSGGTIPLTATLVNNVPSYTV